MRCAKREDPHVVDQNIDMAISEFDRLLGNRARARRVAKVGGNKIRSASCGADFLNRPLAAFRIAANDQNVGAELGELNCHGPADTAGSSSNKSCRIHLQFPFSVSLSPGS
jgi:hypothetical protein